MENFSTHWFTAYYVSLGALLISYGIYLVVKRDSIQNFLIDAAHKESPPSSWKTVLKYFLLFTIPCLILSFIPFSWIELLFSIWCLIIVYVASQFILLWPHTSKAIISSKNRLDKKIRYVAINMVSIGIILFLLAYLLIGKSQGV